MLNGLLTARSAKSPNFRKFIKQLERESDKDVSICRNLLESQSNPLTLINYPDRLVFYSEFLFEHFTDDNNLRALNRRNISDYRPIETDDHTIFKGQSCFKSFEIISNSEALKSTSFPLLMDDEWFSFAEDLFGQDWLEEKDLTQIQSESAIDPPSPIPSPRHETQPQGSLHIECHSKRQRAVFPVQAHRELANWILTHRDFPFASREVENHFITKYSMTRQQVKTAFNNRRQRLLIPLQSKSQQPFDLPDSTRVEPMSLDDGNTILRWFHNDE
jgi:hypothetical protein